MDKKKGWPQHFIGLARGFTGRIMEDSYSKEVEGRGLNRVIWVREREERSGVLPLYVEGASVGLDY